MLLSLLSVVIRKGSVGVVLRKGSLSGHPKPLDKKELFKALRTRVFQTTLFLDFGILRFRFELLARWKNGTFWHKFRPVFVDFFSFSLIFMSDVVDIICPTFRPIESCVFT